MHTYSSPTLVIYSFWSTAQKKRSATLSVSDIQGPSTRPLVSVSLSQTRNAAISISELAPVYKFRVSTCCDGFSTPQKDVPSLSKRHQRYIVHVTTKVVVIYLTKILT